MKKMKNFITAALIAITLAGPAAGLAADKKAEKAKPYPLDKCIVSDEKLGEMGDPYVFVHNGQEIKLCCKSCLKDFKKDPAKYLKKIDKNDKEKK
jgi:YHS domain-containing protein